MGQTDFTHRFIQLVVSFNRPAKPSLTNEKRPRRPSISGKVKVFPLAERESLSQIENILVTRTSRPRACAAACRRVGELRRRHRRRPQAKMPALCSFTARTSSRTARWRIVNSTHRCRLGHASRHQWRRDHPRLGAAFLGRTEESVRENVATGTFGTWDETGRYPPRAACRRAAQRRLRAQSWPLHLTKTASRCLRPNPWKSRFATNPPIPFPRRVPNCCRRCWPTACLRAVSR